jgi:hypothetical protein
MSLIYVITLQCSCYAGKDPYNSNVNQMNGRPCRKSKNMLCVRPQQYALFKEKVGIQTWTWVVLHATSHRQHTAPELFDLTASHDNPLPVLHVWGLPVSTVFISPALLSVTLKSALIQKNWTHIPCHLQLTQELRCNIDMLYMDLAPLHTRSYTTTPITFIVSRIKITVSLCMSYHLNFIWFLSISSFYIVSF